MDLNELTFENIGAWPVSAKFFFTGAICAMILSLFYFLDVKPYQWRIKGLVLANTELHTLYLQKRKQAAHLSLSQTTETKKTSASTVPINALESIPEEVLLEHPKQIETSEVLKTEFITLNYAKAADIANLLKDKSTSLLSVRGGALADMRTNTLIVKDIPAALAEVKELLTQLDIPVKQVLIEARIVDMDTSFESDLGIRWGITKPKHLSGTIKGANEMIENVQNGNLSFQQGNIADRLNVNLPASSSTGAVPGSMGIALANLGNGYLLDLELSAIEDEGGGKVISSPRLLTANQHPAYIESGEEIPYQEATTSGATAVEFKKAVLSLTVTPQITSDNKIVLDLKVNQDRRSLQREVLGTPAINTRQLETNVLVDNGETIVLGGIYEETNNQEVHRIPFLGSIPIVGVFFRNTSKVHDKQELLIFITPKIMVC